MPKQAIKVHEHLLHSHEAMSKKKGWRSCDYSKHLLAKLVGFSRVAWWWNGQQRCQSFSPETLREENSSFNVTFTPKTHVLRTFVFWIFLGLFFKPFRPTCMKIYKEVFKLMLFYVFPTFCLHLPAFCFLFSVVCLLFVYIFRVNNNFRAKTLKAGYARNIKRMRFFGLFQLVCMQSFLTFDWVTEESRW